jgi:hypothetical protein
MSAGHVIVGGGFDTVIEVEDELSPGMSSVSLDVADAVFVMIVPLGTSN